ncbi:Non-heme dioxygenase [Gracilaria domingensis]|nr:Non-heme dioxygenase [Gracilaria domingensis]
MALSAVIDLVDLTSFLSSNQNVTEDCKRVEKSLRDYGAVLIRDPRVGSKDSDKFVNLMERYFEQPSEVKMKDARPELFYQVGVTPNHTEIPRDHSETVSKLNSSEQPVSKVPAVERDPKWRFFWRCGERPSSTDFPELNARQVIPDSFTDEWEDTMNEWGNKLLLSVMTVAEMLALGLGLHKTSITDKMKDGPHLLAPTGSDMGSYGNSVGTTIAGYHYDINILTIHGRSRYPGLFVWTRTGFRIPVHVPEGCLLVQSGIQLEYLTGGLIKRGMHEVVISEDTRRTLKSRVTSGGSQWRVSSTLFGHVRSDASLDPFEQFASTDQAKQYYGLRAGDQIAEELRAIGLAS